MNQNFLWKFQNIYVMDNHRAALWCWMQEVEPERIYHAFHVDAHYDCASAPGATWMQSMPDIRSITFADYLLVLDPHSSRSSPIRAITWDNYLSLFLEKYAPCVDELFTATHLIGTSPEAYSAVHFEEVPPDRFPSFFREYALDTGDRRQWILNLDLDYFFCRLGNEHELMFSDAYIDEVFDAIRCGIRNKRFAVVTVCLSPECCGGWEPAEQLCAVLFDTLKIDFRLPP